MSGIKFTTREKSLLVARLARGKSVLKDRAKEEEVAVDKLLRLLDTLDVVRKRRVGRSKTKMVS